MRTKHAIIATLMLCMGMGAHAQETENNWFIQGQLGASYSLGNAGIGKLIAPAGQIAVGKYFNPTLGHAWPSAAGTGEEKTETTGPPTASITVPLRWTDCST